MAKKSFPGGVWPVMIVPFLNDGKVDYDSIPALVDWYIENGADGLFSVCQSSEMFFLSLEERVNIAEAVVKAANHRVPVIASGNICQNESERVEEVKMIAATGVDAVVLITNSFAKEEDSEEVWMQNCRDFLKKIPENIALGFYECPYPYKRLISLENLKECAETNRFYFLKDTCCDLGLIEKRLEVIKNTNLKLYNANTTTLLATLRRGAYGFSGVMANFHPQFYQYLCSNIKTKKAEELQDFLTIASLIERQWYPVNAKYYMQKYSGLPIEIYCRTKDAKFLTETFKTEIDMLYRLERQMEKQLEE